MVRLTGFEIAFAKNLKCPEWSQNVHTHLKVKIIMATLNTWTWCPGGCPFYSMISSLRDKTEKIKSQITSEWHGKLSVQQQRVHYTSGEAHILSVSLCTQAFSRTRLLKIANTPNDLQNDRRHLLVKITTCTQNTFYHGLIFVRLYSHSYTLTQYLTFYNSMLACYNRHVRHEKYR